MHQIVTKASVGSAYEATNAPLIIDNVINDPFLFALDIVIEHMEHESLSFRNASCDVPQSQEIALHMEKLSFLFTAFKLEFLLAKQKDINFDYLNYLVKKLSIRTK